MCAVVIERHVNAHRILHFARDSLVIIHRWNFVSPSNKQALICAYVARRLLSCTIYIYRSRIRSPD